jgi:hypothetical protein
MNPFAYLLLFSEVLFEPIIQPQSINFTFPILNFLVLTLPQFGFCHQESFSKFSNQLNFEKHQEVIILNPMKEFLLALSKPTMKAIHSVDFQLA